MIYTSIFFYVKFIQLLWLKKTAYYLLLEKSAVYYIGDTYKLCCIRGLIYS